MFHVGQVIVCVDTYPNRRGLTFPAPGQVYTIREIRTDRGDMGFLLEELTNPPHWLGYTTGREFSEPHFLSEMFRPAIKTDISIFTAMLTSPQVNA